MDRPKPSQSSSSPSSSSPRICVVGSTNMDLNSYVKRLPRKGETIHGQRFEISYGGKGANQAVMAAKLGAAVSMVTRVGEDVFGRDALSNFAAHGIDTSQIRTCADTSTGVAAITIDQDGNNTIVVTPGANFQVSVADVEAAKSMIRQAQVVICQLEIPSEATLAALRMGREAGAITLFNPAPAQADLPPEFYAVSDIFCPNETEAATLTGMPVTTMEEAEAAAKELLRRGAGTVILTLGERGSFLVTPTKSVMVPSTPVKAVDTTGAGDAFVGSVAFFLARGLSLEDAMNRANRIAAISVKSPGAQASFPWAEQLPADLLS